MQKIKTFFLNLFSSIGEPIVEEIISTIGESKLESALQDLHDSNIDDYKAAITGASAFIKHMKPLVAKTPNTIDDIVIEDLKDVIEKSAATNGITL